MAGLGGRCPWSVTFAFQGLRVLMGSSVQVSLVGTRFGPGQPVFFWGGLCRIHLGIMEKRI